MFGMCSTIHMCKCLEHDSPLYEIGSVLFGHAMIENRANSPMHDQGRD